MNDLDRQLAELALINKTELTSNSGGTLGKKVGPAVPPKPKKTQPQIPQSYPLKQQVEPSYSTRLQTTQFYSNLPPPPQNFYSNVPPPLKPSINSTPKAYTKPGSGDHVTYSNILQRNQDGLIYSNLMHSTPANSANMGGMYSNLPAPPPQLNATTYMNGGDDLPPPPPPIDDLTNYQQQNLLDYQPSLMVNTNLPPPPPQPLTDDLLPPPPSPVSSSYSELRRATQSSSQDFNNYSLGSQSSSTYESIYEPINPRPPSQMSSRSNYSLYAPYGGGSSSSTSGGIIGGSNCSTMTGPSQSVSRLGNHSIINNNKEREVDNLTDLLVQGMDSNATNGNNTNNGNLEYDVYGICVKCDEKIVGENNGCTAMDQLYHTKCFTCHHCAINLQGKPFYALDGNPYCKEDYLNTLEKCCVCQSPILDRILRATGKPYHPKCFCCVVCGKSLDGIPFTVDATNRVHCIEDFHKIFAPRCWVCQQPIMPEPGEDETVRVVALDHSFHIQCYKCEDCGLVLSSEAEGRGCYPLDGHVLCKSCNAKRVQALTSHMTTEL